MPKDTDYPPEVARLHAALERLDGVSGTRSSIQALGGVNSEQLSLACFAELPHGALRRTGGALPQETLVQVEFQPEQNAAGWRSLEFLAWFVRDAARGSLPVQLRPFALPPTIAQQVQLSHTLRFHLDYFFTDATGHLEPILQAVRRLGDDLTQTIDLYELSLHQCGGPSLTCMS